MAEHGTRTMYNPPYRCRCEPCTEANRVYNRNLDRRHRRIRYGIEDPSTDWVDPTEAREHLLWLNTVGIGQRTIAARTGIARSALRELAAGTTKKIHHRTADRLLAVGRSAAAPGAYIDATRTWELVTDMLYLGATKVSIAEQIGQQRALQLGRTRVTRRNADQIEAAWEQLGRTLAPWHGTYAGYAKRRCRCVRCTAEARRYSRARRAGVNVDELDALEWDAA
jgi:hypothetical protein